MDNPLVSVQMVTYNHEPYIAQAIEGVLQQETDFPIELVIGEDCSTDDTREIVFDYQKKHPDIIRVITSDKNVGGRKNSNRVRKASRGKYIAFCEGDDYWHHPQKLKKQVDFIESNPDYGMVHSDYDELNNKTGQIILSGHQHHNMKIPTDNFYEELLICNFIRTLTVCVRSKLLNQAAMSISGNQQNWLMGDLPLWIELSRQCKIGYIGESLAVYRMLEKSASHSKDVRKQLCFFKSSCDVVFYFMDKYGCSEKTRNIVLRKYHNKIFYYSCLLMDKTNARNSFRFLQTVESNRKERARNYFNYFGSRNRLNWLIIRSLMGVRKHLSGIFCPTLWRW